MSKTNQVKKGHSHKHCKHTEVRYCGDCRETYCMNCPDVWRNKPCKKEHYPYYTRPWTQTYFNLDKPWRIGSLDATGIIPTPTVTGGSQSYKRKITFEHDPSKELLLEGLKTTMCSHGGSQN